MILDDVNALTATEFVEYLGGIYEHSPWIAEKAATLRPFGNYNAMLRAFSEVVAKSEKEQQLALVRAHPDLGHKAGIDPELSTDSAREQGEAGLDRLSPAEYEQFQTLNAAYHHKFNMPFVICVRKASKDIILNAMSQRLASTPEAELAEALKQIDAIASLRLHDKVKK